LFSDEQAIAWFDVKDAVSSPARLDFAKLGHTNNHHMRLADDERLAGLVREHLARSGQTAPDPADARLARTIGLVKEGAKTIVELADLCAFALRGRPFPLPEKIAALLTEETAARLGRLSARLATHPDWSHAALESLLKQFAESEGVGLGKIGPALRGVLSGGSPAPDLASTLAALGLEEASARLKDALSPVA
jgi:glutamyl-tRNA synthetase